ncbi:serine/threonine-protein kinase [Halotia wernerae UHCC 0503]|nr:serine/threonine-protein kinase [Halotia wernerae UHCC 0503]
MLGKLLDGRYQVLQILGGGGFGQTYIAKDTHRPGFPKCVVKHLKPVTHNPEFLQTSRRLFTSEAATLEELGHHDQIPRLLAYFEDNQEFFLVQEFIEGYSLTAELLPNQPWKEDQVIQLLQQVLGILEFIHSHKVIHRDIKPENIIRRQQDGKLVLIDFGAVKQVQTQLLSAPGHVETTIAIGTPGYMSTEQGRGKPRPNSDIYSLGVISIQALTGLHPRQLEENQDTGEILWQHLASVSPELASVLSKMVLHHFRERYQSATEVLEELGQIEAVANRTFTQVQLPVTQLYQQNATVYSPGCILSSTQYNRLEQMLLELVGPVAPTLLRQVKASALNSQELIDNLAFHLREHQQAKFKKQATVLCEESTAQPENTSNLPITEITIVNEAFVHQCEQELANFIGPIATFIVQKAVKDYPHISRAELVRILASHISNHQQVGQFQQRLIG